VLIDSACCGRRYLKHPRCAAMSELASLAEKLTHSSGNGRTFRLVHDACLRLAPSADVVRYFMVFLALTNCSPAAPALTDAGSEDNLLSTT